MLPLRGMCCRLGQADRVQLAQIRICRELKVTSTESVAAMQGNCQLSSRAFVFQRLAMSFMLCSIAAISAICKAQIPSLFMNVADPLELFLLRKNQLLQPLPQSPAAKSPVVHSDNPHKPGLSLSHVDGCGNHP